MKRFGIVGAGSIARTHADRIKKMPGIELAGYYDIFPEASQRSVEQFGGQVYPSLEALLDDVDYVDICTTANAHKEPVLATLEAGVPPLLSKNPWPAISGRLLRNCGGPGPHGHAALCGPGGALLSPVCRGQSQPGQWGHKAHRG